MDFSKAFDCIPHDILITKLDAYSFNKNLERYIYSYLEKRKPCVRVIVLQVALKISCQVLCRDQY